MFRHQNEVSMMLISLDIAGFQEKNSRHVENPRWRPYDAWKKCKHCFSDSVGPKVSKNVWFTKSPKILNEHIFWYIVKWTTLTD